MDSDRVADIDSKKFMVLYVFIIAGGSVFWFSKKNFNVFFFSTKVKYKVIIRVAKEVIWYRRFLDDVGYKQVNLTVIYCDN